MLLPAASAAATSWCTASRRPGGAYRQLPETPTHVVAVGIGSVCGGVAVTVPSARRHPGAAPGPDTQIGHYRQFLGPRDAVSTRLGQDRVELVARIPLQIE